MSKVASEIPDRSDNDKPIAIGRLADTQKSDAHVAQLIHIAEQSSKYLWFRQEIGESLEVDKTLQDESRKTLELAHLRLRELIDESRRWSLDPSAHEREATKLIDSTLALYDQKTINAKIYNRPSIFLRPKIGRFDAGWIAWIGGDLPTRRDLHALGDSPALAMQAFDDAYYDLQKIAETQPTIAVSPTPSVQKRAPRKPKKK